MALYEFYTIKFTHCNYIYSVILLNLELCHHYYSPVFEHFHYHPPPQILEFFYSQSPTPALRQSLICFLTP